MVKNRTVLAVSLLAASIFFGELFLMFLFDMVILDQTPPWGFAALDGIAISFITIVTIFIMDSRSIITLSKDGRSEIIVLKVGTIIFSIEAIIMFIFSLDLVNLNWWQQIIADSVLLTLLVVPLIYVAVLRRSLMRGDQIEISKKDTLTTNIILLVCMLTLLFVAFYIAYVQHIEMAIDDLVKEVDADFKVIEKMAEQNYESIIEDLHLYVHDYKNISHLKTGGSQYFKAALESEKNYQSLMIVNQKQTANLALRKTDDGQVETFSYSQADQKSIGSAVNISDLHDNEIYVSKLQFDNINDQVGQRSKPFLMFITPIEYSSHDKEFLILKVDGNIFLNEVNELSLVDANVSVIDQFGDWIYQQGKTTLKSILNSKDNDTFIKQHPDVWMQLNAAENGMIETENSIFLVKKINYNQNQSKKTGYFFWWLVAEFEREAFMAKHKTFTYVLFTLYFMFILFLCLAVVIFARAKSKSVTADIRLNKLAYFDSLTNLYNRRSFLSKLSDEINTAVENKTNVAVMFLDLNKFKHINDTYGHAFGDLAIQEAARRISKCIRTCDIASRLGGDEFAVMLLAISSDAQVVYVADRIIKEFEAKFHLDTVIDNIGVSIGISILRGSESAEELLKRADNAMYKAKEKGGSCYIFAD